MKTTKKILSLILSVVMLFSLCSFPVMAEETTNVTLTDIDSSTLEGKAVTRLASMGIINGYPDGTFKAGNAITRAEFCVVMIKFENLQNNINPDAMTGFEDLDLDDNYKWARPYVSMAVQRGIINGFEDGTFRAADPVTYEQAIKMIVCSLGYGETAKKPTVEGDWSSGYIARALKLGITTGTSIAKKTEVTDRGTVAILVNNALDADRADIGFEGDYVMDGGNSFDDLGYDEAKGIVTGTYLTELTDQDSEVPRDHIQIGRNIYEIGFSRDPNEFLGCYVKAILEDNEDGDYPKATSIEVDSRTRVNTVSAELLGGYADGEVEYRVSTNGVWKKQKIADNYITIFNNKLYDYAIEDVIEDLDAGYVEFIDNNGDGRADVVRVHSYEVFVVASKSNNTQKITLMYGATYEGETSFSFPGESTSLVFSLTRNGKEIKFTEIAKWDVLNIKASPSDAEGRRYYEVVVTRQTASGMIEEIEENGLTYVTIKDEEYAVAPSYEEYTGEDKVELKIGENAQVYIDAFGRIVAAAEVSSGDSSEAYAYLWGVRQDSDDSEYDLEFWLYTTSGKELQIGAASKIKLDGVKYKALDDDILDELEKSADKANSYYPNAKNVVYQQPIIYQTNSEGLISVIHTVNSPDNEDISTTMVDEDGDPYFVPYSEGESGEGRPYKSSSKNFAVNNVTAFKVSSSTKIMFVPDNRANTEDYLIFSSYSKAFSNGRSYHVEAYGLTSSKTASLVLIYSQNDSRIYTSSSPWMIVASKSNTAAGTIIKGYTGTSYSLKSVTLSEEDGPSVSEIGKGDIIRYILDGSGELIDYQIWFDASDPDQLDPISDAYDEAYATDEEDISKRILEIHSTSTVPRRAYPQATFRLQYGTVTGITLDDGTDSVDEEAIDISPYIVEDNVEITNDKDDRGFMSKEIGSSVKVFGFDRGGRNSEVMTDVDLNEILDYETYGEDATRVIIYTASGTLRMIYIVTD